MISSRTAVAGAAPQGGDWQRLKSILADALDLPTEQRLAFITQQARDLQELGELQALLNASQTSDHPLLGQKVPSRLHGAWARDLARKPAERMNHQTDSSVVVQTVRLDEFSNLAKPSKQTSWAGRQIGPYHLTELIAHGGMGHVYRARRLDKPSQPDVAVKLMRDGLLTEALQKRFELERHTLARLHHPNLARLLDSGITDNALPYFVMELIEGEPIDAYCRRHRLGIIETLQLMLALCQVVHYAHCKGVVHRDLKPANVLVNAQGQIKLVDFGIAKSLSQDEHASTVTVTMLRMMTLACASPEQVRGDPITPASDIYSLGVMLYALLTGASPYAEAASGGDFVLRNAICESTPMRPSQVVKDDHIHSGLNKDIDAVILKALQKVPQKRYRSARHLAEDINRFLQDQRVYARWSWLHQGRRLLKEGRWAVLTGLVGCLAVILSSGLSLHAAHQAEQQVAQSRQQRLDDVNRWLQATLRWQEALQNMPGTNDMRRDMLQHSLQQLSSLDSPINRDNVEFHVGRAGAYARWAQMQGGVGVWSLEDTVGALNTYKQALAIVEQVLLIKIGDGQNPTNTLHRAALAVRADVHAQLARLLHQQSQTESAQTHARQAIRDALALRKNTPEDAQTRRLLEFAYQSWSEVAPDIAAPSF